jgi:hypothetical protein
VKGDIGEETDLEAQGEDLVGVGGEVDVLAAGAEVGEGGVGGAGEFEAGGDEGAVEFEDGAELELEAEVHGGGGEGAAFEDPSSALGEERGELGQEGEAVAVAIGEEVEGLGGAGGGMSCEAVLLEVGELRLHGVCPAFLVVAGDADCRQSVHRVGGVRARRVSARGRINGHSTNRG